MKTIEVAMLGLGTVGSGVLDILKHIRTPHIRNRTSDHRI